LFPNPVRVLPWLWQRFRSLWRQRIPAPSLSTEKEVSEKKDLSSKSHLWAPGDLVERLLDDISDIWVGATVVAFRGHDTEGNELYDVAYCDNGSIEQDVEGQDLRPRNLQLDMLPEVWECVGGCFREKQDLAALESLARNAQVASRKNASSWWSTAYHHRFGRCSPRCCFDRVDGAEGSRMAETAIADCVAAAELGLTPPERLSWKVRYQDLQKLNEGDALCLDCPDSPTAPGDAAYSVSGKKVSFGSSLGNMFFDPRLGHMVREG